MSTLGDCYKMWENRSAESENLWCDCFNNHLSALLRWSVHHCFQLFSSLRIFYHVAFYNSKDFHCSTYSRHSSPRESLFLPGLLRTCANELNSSIQLWKQLIIFHRRKSPTLSLYAFTYSMSCAHTRTTKIRQGPVQWWTINVMGGTSVS